MEHDVQHINQRLDIIHHGRFSEQAGLSRKWWFVARLSAKSLNRIEQRCLLTADIGAGAAPHLDLKSKIMTQDSLTEETTLPAAFDGAGEPVEGQRILAPDIQVGLFTARGKAGNRHRLDQGEGIPFHYDAVLESAGLRLVGIADQVSRADSRDPIFSLWGMPPHLVRAAWSRLPPCTTRSRPNLRARLRAS